VNEMDDVSRFLPVKSTVFLILIAVAEEPRHGYGIMQSVLRRSDGAVNLGTGHLYRHIRRLLDDGLLEEVEPDRVDSEDPRRRYYQLTDLGAEVVRAESERLKALVAESRKLGFV
jgi:DNA-binding PadR family transcriptional regulator